MVELALEEEDQETFDDAKNEADALDAVLEKLEFRRMFSGDQDANNCYLDIQSGSGGTEAQDWATKCSCACIYAGGKHMVLKLKRLK